MMKVVLVFLTLVCVVFAGSPVKEEIPQSVIDALKAKTAALAKTAGKEDVKAHLAVIEKIKSLKLPHVSSLAITLDSEEGKTHTRKGESKSSWIVEVGWWDEALATEKDLKKVASAHREFFNKLMDAIKPDLSKNQVIVEVVQSPPSKAEMPGEAAGAKTVSFLDLGLTHRTKGKGRSGARAPPTKLMGGLALTECASATAVPDFGTLGGILTDDTDYFAATNNHVFPNKAYLSRWNMGVDACKNAGTKPVASERYNAWDKNAGDWLETSTGSADVERFGTADETLDFAIAKIKKTLKINCGIGPSNANAITGVVAETPTATWAVKKSGARTGSTLGVIKSYAAYSANSWGSWYYRINGNYPEIPWDTRNRVASGVRVPSGSSTAITSKSDALAQTPAWDPSTIFELPGDSGSWVFDFDNKLVAVAFGGGWTRALDSSGSYGPYVRHTDAIPFDALLKKINTGRAKALKVCTSTGDVTV